MTLATDLDDEGRVPSAKLAYMEIRFWEVEGLRVPESECFSDFVSVSDRNLETDYLSNSLGI